MDYIVFNQTELDKTIRSGCICLCDNTYNLPTDGGVSYAAVGEVKASIDLSAEECKRRGIKFLNFTPVYLTPPEVKAVPQNTYVPIKWEGVSAVDSYGSFGGSFSSYVNSFGGSFSSSYRLGFNTSASYLTSYRTSYRYSYIGLYLTSYRTSYLSSYGGAYLTSYRTSYLSSYAGAYRTSYNGSYAAGSFRLASSYLLRLLTSYKSSFFTSYRTSGSFKKNRSFRLKKNINGVSVNNSDIEYVSVNGYGINLI